MFKLKKLLQITRFSGWDLVRDVELSQIPIYREILQEEERTDLNLLFIILMLWSITMSGLGIRTLQR
ncbi:MAG TPA: hypothetical protein DIS94_11860 [Bacteroidetes bacterium]|nr:hypothetical protein [Bacteroidota bacterium]